MFSSFPLLKITLICFFLPFLAACNLEVPGADEKFGRQNFISAISMIELHKLRNNTYPSTLKNLEYLGDWDSIWLSGVRYQTNGNGYDLFLERGWTGKPTIELPEGFKSGLGLINTNVVWVKSKK